MNIPFIGEIQFEKKFLYDWMGTNEWLFKEIHGLSGDETYNSLMVFLSNIADHKHFHYIMGMLLSFALAEYIWRKVTRRGAAAASLTLWLGVFLVLVGSHIVTGLAVHHFKGEFQYPRPYVYVDDVKPLVPRKDAEDDYRSFPSGHATHISVIVTALWPVMFGNAGLIGVGLIFAVCWSRIAVGMHFPADVLAGFLIGFFVTLIIRWIVYSLLFKLFRLKC